MNIYEFSCYNNDLNKIKVDFMGKECFCLFSCVFFLKCDREWVNKLLVL